MINHPNRSKRRPAATAASSVVKRTVAPRKAPIVTRPDHDADYHRFLLGVSRTFQTSGQPLFQTDAKLVDLYLGNLRPERQVHDCRACKRFIESFGALATISDDGCLTSAFWAADTVPLFYRKAVSKMAAAVIAANVVSPFLSNDLVWGKDSDGPYAHVWARNPFAFNHATLSAEQAMAVKREDYKNILVALGEFNLKVVNEAVRVLETEQLTRSEKFLGPVQWLQGLHAARNATLDRHRRANMTWLAIAGAPDGYLHPRASIVGSLLEDIAAGKTFEQVRKAFDAKMHPLKYQRPQAAPKAGNVAAAEKLFDRMGLERSLNRRAALLNEVQTAWAPFVPKRRPQRATGIFSHLAPRGSSGHPVTERTGQAVVMTWAKFTRNVLPAAEGIEVWIPVTKVPFIGFTTATHDDAPPLIRWDRENERNPFSWYLYTDGSVGSDWNITANAWAKVEAIVPLPTIWGDEPKPHLGEGYVLALSNCRDRRGPAGTVIWPEHVREELHGVRATIEAHSKSDTLIKPDGQWCAGLDVRRSNNAINYLLRVTSGGSMTTYLIDRWD